MKAHHGRPEEGLFVHDSELYRKTEQMSTQFKNVAHLKNSPKEYKHKCSYFIILNETFILLCTTISTYIHHQI